jgi:hypothetical protein
MSKDPNANDPSIVAQARECLRLRQAGEFDLPAWHESSRPILTSLRPASANILAPLGEPLTFDFVGSQTDRLGLTRYRYHVTFSNARVLYIFGRRPDGKIGQFSIKPIPGEPDPFAHLWANLPKRPESEP